MKYIFEQMKILEELKGITDITRVNELLDLLRRDDDLSIYFYGGEKGDDYPDFTWLGALYRAGEFDNLDVLAFQSEMIHKFKADFIREACRTVPNTVFDIITSMKVHDPWIQKTFLQAMQEMPTELIENALWLIWDYLGEKKTQVWRWQGEEAATIMLKLMDDKPNYAFAIARLLFEMWCPQKEERIGSRDICIRFQEHEYSELIQQYFMKLWEKYPYRAFDVLVRNLNYCLNEVLRQSDSDPSEYYYITVENIDKGSSWEHNNLISIYMCALRDCLNYLAEHEPSAIDKTLNLLQYCNKAVFTRYEIYLLSKIDAAAYIDRINQIAQTELYFNSSCYRNEYNMLVSSKSELLTSETKQKILEYVDNIHVYDLLHFKEDFKKLNDRECTGKDIERHESQRRAQRLYPIKTVFPDEYEKYEQLSGVQEEKLKPVSTHSGGFRSIAGDEGTPLSTKEMNDMTAEEVVDYLLNPENYCNFQPKEFFHNSPIEALGYAFQKVVKRRPVEFLNVEVNKISSLSHDFISRFFNGIWEPLREKEIDGFSWDRFLELAQVVVEKCKHIKPANELRPLPRCIQEAFKDANKIEYSVERLNIILSIVEPLLSVEEEISDCDGRDPIQIQCNSVAGEAFSICISLGVVFKRDIPEEFENDFRGKLESIFLKVLREIKKRWVVCLFGSEFPRIYWIVPEWVEQNLGSILSDEHWNAVWGTYLHWGRPSKVLFEILSRKGFYSKAIVKCDKVVSRSSGESLAEELAKHFVIAYFNGWMESYEDTLLQEFLSAGSDELLAFTAHFFTTGFESQKLESQEGVNDRLKIYWKKRLEIAESKPDEHIQEAAALSYWIKDCPFDYTEALELTIRSINLCQGKLRNDFEARDCIKALCEIINDANRLNIIRCVRLIAQNPPEYMHWGDLFDGIDKLIKPIIDDSHADQSLIKEAMGLADDLGRLREFRYRGEFEDLSKRLTS